MNSLTQKERMYLDETSRGLCIKKYHQAAEQAQDRVKRFIYATSKSRAATSDTINQMLSGQILK